MTRLYYDCPIKALYMLKEFGVEICKNNHNVPNWHLGDLLCIDFGKIYVAPESEHIFEQKEGDLGLQQYDDYFAIAKAHEHEDFETFDGFTSGSRHWTIIMRDGKHFFMPNIENK